MLRVTLRTLFYFFR